MASRGRAAPTPHPAGSLRFLIACWIF